VDQTPFVQPTPPQYPPPYYLPVNPIAGPVKVIGIIYAVFAVMSLFGVFWMVVMSGFLMQGSVQPIEGIDANVARAAPLFMAIAVFVLLISLLNGATAYGLLARKPWGRTLAIIVSIVSLLSIPFGTILGGVSLYFLLRQGAEQDYARLTLGQP
jgi:hypothetical protein